MRELKWDSTDFLECLEVFPEFNEDAYSYSYEVVRNELVLTLTVFELESRVCFSLRQSKDAKPALNYSVFVRDGVFLVVGTQGSYLEFRGCFIAGPEFFSRELQLEKLQNERVFTVQLEVKTQIQIHLI